MLQLPAIVCSRGLVSLSWVCRAVAKIVCVVVIPFCHRPAAALSSSLKFFSSVPNNSPVWGSDPASAPPPLGAGAVLLLSSPSFVLLSFAWVCTFLSGGQRFLLVLSWCSARSSVSKGVIQVHPWREIFLHIHLLIHHLPSTHLN